MLDLTMNQIPCGTETCDYHPKKENIGDEIDAMRQKEDTSYKCGDYVLRRKLEYLNISSESISSVSTTSQPCKSETVVDEGHEIDSSCRTTMCEWCYRVVDHFGARRELVEISMNYLDRLLDKFNCDRTAYKLAAITSMYLAIKLFNQKSLNMRSLSMLSRGEFSVIHIAEMERFILQALAWNLYPPTSVNFIYRFHSLLPSIKDSAKRTILQRSSFFAELAVMEYTFVTFNASDIAFSAILNAMDGLDVSLMSQEERNLYIKRIEKVSAVDHMSKIITSVREKIWGLYSHSAQFELHDIEIKSERYSQSQECNKIETYEGSSRDMSPVCIMNT